MPKKQSNQPVKRTRATEEKQEHRIELMINLMVQAVSHSHATKMLAKSEQISIAQARRYLEKAYERIRIFGSQPIIETVGLLGQRLEYLLSKAMLDKNYTMVTEFLKLQINLLQMQYKYPTAGVISHVETSASKQSKQAELEELVRRIESRRSSHE